MKNFLLLFLLFFYIYSAFAQNEGRFMRYPDIYKDKIVFCYEGDLWTVSIKGGLAIRITNFPGGEISPKFSPDGKWIAFTASYDGAPNVYIIPAEGGEPKRITYVGGAQVVEWTPDGERIVFRSFFENFIGRDPNLYFVNKNGSAPEKLPTDRGRQCSFSIDGKKMIYTRKGDEDYYWKRYKGGRYCDLWMYDFQTDKFTPVSDYIGKNAYPMWVENKLYFLSDRNESGISNLYCQDLNSKQITDITKYTDFDVMMPSTDGESIVFVQNGYISVLDIKSKEMKKISILLNSDRWNLRPRYINPKDYIQSVNISNDGKTSTIEARGDIFNIPLDKGQTTNLSNSPGTRETYPQISPDGKWVAFFSDKSGEYQIYMQKTEGGEWIQLTTKLDRTNYQLLWSPDGKKILFGNKDFSLFYIDIDTKKLTKIDESNQMKNDEFYWQVSDYSWSPDSKWICYSFVQYNKNNKIFIYSLEQDKKYAITDDFYDNLNPCFDANGKNLYYLSSRNFDVQMDFYEDNHIYSNPYQIVCVQLRSNDKAVTSESTKENKKQPETFRIDIEGIQKRTTVLPISAGNYFYLRAGKGRILYSSVSEFSEDEYEEIFKPKGNTKWDLHIYDVEQNKDVIINQKIKDYKLSTNGEQLIIQKDNEIYYGSVDNAFNSANPGKKMNLSGMLYYIDYQKEWNQIFTDAWRWYRDFFYDPQMHGRDWKAIGDKYRAYIANISSRSELNWILEQMVGELCVSHTYIGGGDFSPSINISSPLFTGWLGADLVKDEKAGYYKFAKIYGPDEYNLNLKAPLSTPDIEINEGYYLISINGNEIKPPDDYFKYLQVIPGQKVKIRINSKPSSIGSKEYEIEPIQNNQNLRYFRWIKDNIDKISKTTDGKVGYMHINAMNSRGIAEFDKYWRAFRYKEGLIIDVRRNSGGWTEYFMIDKLERKMTAYNVLKGMKPFRYPGSTSTGHYIVLSNEYNGSDGEAFVEDFKANKLGTVVGVCSWGGLVGILNTQITIDNGTVEQSNNAFWGADGKWIVENHGADPDITIDNDPQSMREGRDVQLEKAIETALEKIKNSPFKFAPQPAYPKK
jgi:tricorn protease